MNFYKFIKTMKTPILILLAIILLSGCGATPSQESIYDQDEKLVNVVDSYFFTTRLGSVNKDNMEITFKKFYGVETIWKIEAEHESITFTIDAQIDRGEFKVILVTFDKQIINLSENSINGKVTVKTEPGEYRLKIVGRDAYGSIRMIYNQDY